MFERILGMFEPESTEPSWKEHSKNSAEIKERMKEAKVVVEQLHAAAVSGNYGDCTVQFPWEGGEIELPPVNEPPKNGDFEVRCWNRMLGAFFCHPTDSGGFVSPICFKKHYQLPDKVNAQRKQEEANYAVRCVFEGFQELLRDPALLQLATKYMTPVQNNSPEALSVEDKRDILIRFLHGEGWLPEWYTPLILRSDRNNVDPQATTDELETAYKLIGRLIQTNLERIQREYADMKKAVRRLIAYT